MTIIYLLMDVRYYRPSNSNHNCHDGKLYREIKPMSTEIASARAVKDMIQGPKGIVVVQLTGHIPNYHYTGK